MRLRRVSMSIMFGVGLRHQWLLISLERKILVSCLIVTAVHTCVCLCIITIGTQAKEYPTRFFARDYGGNLLEFTM